MLWTSDALSTSHLSQCPSKPAYYVYCRLSEFKSFVRTKENVFRWEENFWYYTGLHAWVSLCPLLQLWCVSLEPLNGGFNIYPHLENGIIKNIVLCIVYTEALYILSRAFLNVAKLENYTWRISSCFSWSDMFLFTTKWQYRASV